MTLTHARATEASDTATTERSAGGANLLAPAPARLLPLQQTAGNRAVGRLLRQRPHAHPRRVLARYEPGEHIQFGTSGRTVPLAGLKGIDERYLIAMGDFYKSPEALMAAKEGEIKELIALVDRDEKARTGQGGSSPGEDDWQ